MHRFIIQKNTEKINGQKKVPMLGSYYIGSFGYLCQYFQNRTLLVRRLHRKSTSLLRFEEQSETGADSDSRASTGLVKNCFRPKDKLLKYC